MAKATFRQVLGAFPSGVTVVTTHHKGEDLGLTVSAFASLSLDPEMVLVSIDNSSRTLAVLSVGAPIAVSILAAHQGAVARQFASGLPDKFAGVACRRLGDVPVIEDAAGWISGRVAGLFPGGDHTIVTIAVSHLELSGNPPMVYANGIIGS
ncbi:flavin reductase family protein [Corynebacterium sp. H128]|uniref:flavin reductase family protein n=1 Tax=unclassified Corynebacterium TaxID=2624378 RepID=UPI0030A53113